jgi:hypothetical protein
MSVTVGYSNTGVLQRVPPGCMALHVITCCCLFTVRERVFYQERFWY